MALISKHVSVKLLFKRRRGNLHRNNIYEVLICDHFISSDLYNAGDRTEKIKVMLMYRSGSRAEC